MDRKFDNEAKAAKTTTTMTQDGAKQRRSKSDDCSQIDNIIGSFGKYQLMIFLFKILIGLVCQFYSAESTTSC